MQESKFCDLSTWLIDPIERFVPPLNSQARALESQTQWTQGPFRAAKEFKWH